MMARGRQAWNGFWFAPQHTHSLCLLRLFFGIVVATAVEIGADG